MTVDPLDPWTFLLVALAAYRVTRLVVRDSISEPLRRRLEPLVEDPRRHALAPVAGVVAYVLLCPWCLSVYVAGALYGLVVAAGDLPPVRGGVGVLAVAAVAGLLLDRDRS